MEECDFIQNGLKVEYTTRESRVNEYQRILEALFKDNLYVKEEKTVFLLIVKILIIVLNLYKIMKY